MKTFAERLKFAMSEAKLNQLALSEKSGASKAAISQYLSGKNTPGPDRVQALADATGVSFGFLMGFESLTGERNARSPADVKITFVKACRCLQKSEDSIRKLMMEGCDFGKAVPGSGGRLNYIFFPGKFREYVGAERFDSFFGLTS